MVTIRPGHCIDVLRTLPAKSVHCCVTSPPYWGLRDYGVTPSVWGGRDDCAHEWGSKVSHRAQTGGTNKSTLANYANGLNESTIKEKIKGQSHAGADSQFCVHCNAWLGCHGLEPTPELFVHHEVLIFREVWRVLRDDGTLWINLGDSYAGSGRGGNPTEATSTLQGGQASQQASIIGRKIQRGSLRPAGKHESARIAGAIGRAWVPAPTGLKNKDLVGIPWRVAFALQADGWYLRSDVIWSKPNPMPESVTDRPTKSHEYIFLLSKTDRYHYDAKAIEEPQAEHERTRRLKEQARGLSTTYNLMRDQPHGQHAPGKTGCARSVQARQKLAEKGTRNKRSVWTVPTHPYKDAHFATFPPALIRPCILAGCPKGGTTLDVFGGSGTVGEVCEEEGRNSILIELNPQYVGLAERRTAQAGLLHSA